MLRKMRELSYQRPTRATMSMIRAKCSSRFQKRQAWMFTYSLAPTYGLQSSVTICSPNTLRTIPFRIGSIRGPNRAHWDMSLNKKVYLSERFNLQARLEAFNVFNSVVRNNPGTVPTNASTFGIVTLSQSNIPRQVQLGFKLNF